MPIFDVNLTTVVLAAALTALATGLGALPFLLVRRISPTVLGVSQALAAGLMLAASHGLIAEGIALNPTRLLVGMLLGLAAIELAKALIDGREHPELGLLSGVDARKAFLIIAVMTAHSFAEGIGVGVSFGGSGELATFITAAIAAHNIPEGLAISLILVPRGFSVLQAAAWSVFSSLPQPLMAAPAYLFVRWFEPLLPVGLGLAAGAMIWMVFAEIIPDANKEVSPQTTAVAVVLAMATMLAFQYLVLKA